MPLSKFVTLLMHDSDLALKEILSMKLLSFIFFLTISIEVIAMESILSVTSEKYKIVEVTDEMDVNMYREESEAMTYENYREFNRYDLWIDEIKQKLIFTPVFLAPMYEYTRVLSDSDSMLIITSFKSERTELGINQSIPIISALPMSEWGKATYQLTLALETIEFQSFADRKKWTIRDYYKSYIEVYQAKANGKAYYLLEIGEPNRFYNDNGLYFVAPLF